MATVEVDVRDQIIAFKRKLAPNRDVLKRAFADVQGPRHSRRRQHPQRDRRGAACGA